MTDGFISRLASRVASHGNCLCVGIDPRLEMLPRELRTMTGVADAYETFGRAVVDAVAGVAVAVKPQSAFFEALGWRGVRALENVGRHARESGLLVIGDVKRGDIGTTAAAYAQAAFDEPLFDAVTVNPYMGSDSVLPFVERAADCGGGVFILLRTSNPSSSEIQEITAAGEPLYLAVARLIDEWTTSTPGARDVIGAVVGATQPGPLAAIRRVLSETWLLVPGLGVQGGDADELLRAAGSPRRILVNLSRNVCFPWLFDGTSEGDWREQIRAAAVRWAVTLRDGAAGPQ